MLAAAALLGGRWLRWPLLAHRRVYVSACAGPALLFVGVVVGVACLVSPGDPPPLPYVPLLNPLVVLLAALAWVGSVWIAAARSGRDEPAGGEDPPVRTLPAASGGEGPPVWALPAAAGGEGPRCRWRPGASRWRPWSWPAPSTTGAMCGGTPRR